MSIPLTPFSLSSNRPRRALAQIHAEVQRERESIGKKNSISTGQENIHNTRNVNITGTPRKAKENTEENQSRSRSAPTTPEHARIIAEEDEQEKGSINVPRSLQKTPTEFVPVPLHTNVHRTIQRAHKDPGPASGKLVPPIRSTLFPTVGEGVPASQDSPMLQHGLPQILASKESARKYIEMIRKKIYQYMVLNKEYANTHATEQLRNRGIATLKKTLTAKIQQFELLEKNLSRQKDVKLEAAQSRITFIEKELDSWQQRHTAVMQELSQLREMHRDMQTAHKIAMEKQQSHHEQALELIQEGARADTIGIQTALNQSEREKADAMEEIERLRHEINQLQMLQLQPAIEATAQRSSDASTSGYAQLLEVALENASQEVERLQEERDRRNAKLNDAVADLHKMYDAHDRRKTALNRITRERDQKTREIVKLQSAEHRLESELQDQREECEAYKLAYESTVNEKEQMEKGFRQLIEEFELLRGSLTELMLEQGNTIPLPLDILDSNPELSALLASGGAVPAEDEDHPVESFLVHDDSNPLLSRPPSGHRDTDRTSSLFPHEFSSNDSLEELNLSNVPRRLSMGSSSSSDLHTTASIKGSTRGKQHMQNASANLSHSFKVYEDDIDEMNPSVYVTPMQRTLFSSSGGSSFIEGFASQPRSIATTASPVRLSSSVGSSPARRILGRDLMNTINFNSSTPSEETAPKSSSGSILNIAATGSAGSSATGPTSRAARDTAARALKF